MFNTFPEIREYITSKKKKMEGKKPVENLETNKKQSNYWNTNPHWLEKPEDSTKENYPEST